MNAYARLLPQVELSSKGKRLVLLESYNPGVPEVGGLSSAEPAANVCSSSSAPQLEAEGSDVPLKLGYLSSSKVTEKQFQWLARTN